MYICNKCSRVSEAGKSCYTLPIAVREKEYKTEKGVFYGWEVAAEGHFCAICAIDISISIPEKKPPIYFKQSEHRPRKKMRDNKDSGRQEKQDFRKKKGSIRDREVWKKENVRTFL